jgi:hypothetical protein
VEKEQATAEADPYGMTNKRTNKRRDKKERQKGRQKDKQQRQAMTT